jgi:hypothetical protein
MVQPLPRVEAALLFADLFEESEDRVRPALDNAAFEGLLMLLTSSHVTARVARRTDRTGAPGRKGCEMRC